MVMSREDCEDYSEKKEQEELSKGSKLPANRGPGRAPTTWAEKSRWDMSIPELIASLDIGPASQYEEKKGKQLNRGPVQYRSVARENMFILPCALAPIVFQSLCYYLFPKTTWHPFAAWMLYHLAFDAFAIANMKRLHVAAEEYGTLDEQKRARDIIDDSKVHHLGWSILLYTSIRTLGPVLLTYNRYDMPITLFDGFSPMRIMAWEVILDLFFYIYHSACHRIDSLWFIHRAHHGTKHPTAILSILADDWQEIIEVILCPTLASWVLPLRFSEGYVALVYLLYVEMLGHSGIRAYWPHPLLSWILKPMDMELAVEDHDLHHRGGRGGLNFGKQTRIWDKLGNSVGERVECIGF